MFFDATSVYVNVGCILEPCNVKMDLQEMGGGCGDWMELAQDRERWRALVSTVMNLLVP